MSREHIVGSVHRRGQQKAAFATLVGLAQRFEATKASFSAILTDTLHLRVAQMPRSPDLAIFVLLDDNDDRLHYPLRMRAG